MKDGLDDIVGKQIAAAESYPPALKSFNPFSTVAIASKSRRLSASIHAGRCSITPSPAPGSRVAKRDAIRPSPGYGAREHGLVLL